MIYLKRTNSEDPDFIELVRLLDSDLAKRNGDLNSFYSQYNKIDLLRQTIVAYEDHVPVGCGAFKKFDASTVEIKRMYVKESARGKKVATKILLELETWAQELNNTYCALETGTMNPEALNLYQKSGYERGDNFGPYIGVETSICMRKSI